MGGNRPSEACTGPENFTEGKEHHPSLRTLPLPTGNRSFIPPSDPLLLNWLRAEQRWAARLLLMNPSGAEGVQMDGVGSQTGAVTVMGL